MSTNLVNTMKALKIPVKMKTEVSCPVKQVHDLEELEDDGHCVGVQEEPRQEHQEEPHFTFHFLFPNPMQFFLFSSNNSVQINSYMTTLHIVMD